MQPNIFIFKDQYRIQFSAHKERPAPISDVDENKFPKVAEAIRAIKNKL